MTDPQITRKDGRCEFRQAPVMKTAEMAFAVLADSQPTARAHVTVGGSDEVGYGVFLTPGRVQLTATAELTTEAQALALLPFYRRCYGGRRA